MEFRDLRAQYQKLKPQIMKAVEQECESAHFISGPSVRELETELSEYVGVKHCITCANGTDALLLALMAWGIGPGDAVFVPDFTFFSSGEVVANCGATPVFVDVCENTFNMNPCKLEQAIQKVSKEGRLNPKVVIPVDLFGQPADFKSIRKIADQYHLRILEDGAQGFGGMIGNQRACSFGDVSTTSFFPAKPLGCYGDGGAVFTNDDEIAQLIRSLAVHGKGKVKYDNVRIGMNSRLDTIQAAILKVKLKAFREYELEAVNQIAHTYSAMLEGKLNIPVISEGMLSSWAQYTVVLRSKEERDYLHDELEKQGIPTMIYYMKAMHKQKAFQGTYSSMADAPVTEKLCDTVLSLPMHPYMSQQDVEFIVNTILDILK